MFKCIIIQMRNNSYVVFGKSRFHGRYDLPKLQEVCPELTEYVFVNDYGNETINFHDPKAVKMLNKALLAHHYKIKNWDIPENEQAKKVAKSTVPATKQNGVSNRPNKH